MQMKESFDVCLSEVIFKCTQRFDLIFQHFTKKLTLLRDNTVFHSIWTLFSWFWIEFMKTFIKHFFDFMSFDDQRTIRLKMLIITSTNRISSKNSRAFENLFIKIWYNFINVITANDEVPKKLQNWVNTKKGEQIKFRLFENFQSSLTSEKLALI